MNTIELTPMTSSDSLQTAVATLDQSRAAACLNAFAPFLAAAEEWKKQAAAIVITDVSQKKEMEFARQSRLALKELRVTVEKNRKRLKEDCLAEGRAIDNAAKIVSDIVEPLETHLLAQENYAKNKEHDRLMALKASREDALRPFVLDLTPYVLAGMTEESFATLLAGAKVAHAARQEEVRKAEAERLAKIEAERVERERINAENARLKLEAEAREKAMQAERDKAAAERKSIEEKARLERQAAEAAAKVEREAREKAEAEIQRQKAEQAAKEKAIADAAKKAANAPDKEKLIAYATALRQLPIPSVASSTVKSNLDQLIATVLSQAQAM